MRCHGPLMFSALLLTANLAALSVSCPARAAEPPAPILLWPGQAPGEKGDIGPEHEQQKAGDTIVRVANVSVPSITVYPPAEAKNTGAAVVIFPGGGYSILAIKHEGTEVAEWLNTLGVTGIVVKYRVPARKGLPPYTAALQDAQRAVSLVRQRASEWNIKPDRIGVLGFSAGGHLAAAVSNNYEKRTYEPIDETDRVACRPDFAALIYPAYLVQNKVGPALSPELPITSNTPPTFLTMTEDDGIGVEGPLFYYLALKNAKVPAEMHLHAKGGHGYGLRPSNNLVSNWPARAGDWMRSLGVLEPGK